MRSRRRAASATRSASSPGNSALLDGPSPAEYVVKDDRMCSNVPIQAASGPDALEDRRAGKTKDA